jgi:hypothetical protein
MLRIDNKSAQLRVLDDFDETKFKKFNYNLLKTLKLFRNLVLLPFALVLLYRYKPNKNGYSLYFQANT